MDGCSAPTFAMPVVNAALGYARLSQPELFFTGKRVNAIRTMLDSVTTAPEFVWGTLGLDSLLMKGV